jgi:hypothetical protein
MNKRRKKLLMEMQLCSVLLFTSFYAASVRAQTPAIAPAIDDRGETTTVLPFESRFKLWFAPSASRLMPANSTCNNIDNVIKELDTAWRMSGDGANDREAVVLIFRMPDGSYTGRLQRFTNEFNELTFRWDPAAVAIVHTHPNSCSPRPSEQDRRVADKWGVPNYTITIKGMYVYDPATKKTSKVLNRLDWLNLSKWIPEMARRVDNSFPYTAAETLYSQKPCNGPRAGLASHVPMSPRKGTRLSVRALRLDTIKVEDETMGHLPWVVIGEVILGDWA